MFQVYVVWLLNDSKELQPINDPTKLY
jgi:hypothetical protein